MTLTLRTRILLFLFVFALVPLLAAVLINLPLVLERVELFYRHAFLQNLRADFSDLDKHVASRYEMINLLAKLPEPGVVLGTESEVEWEQIKLARVRYTEWVNRILHDQRDVIDILFLDKLGVSRFWLSRNPLNQSWEPTIIQPPRPMAPLISTTLEASAPMVLVTAVNVDQDPKDPARAVTLQLISPIGVGEGEEVSGAVVITLDIGGLVRRDASTLWVHSDGRYLTVPGVPKRDGNAFDEFSGLREQFVTEQVVLWEGKDRESVIWVPLLRTGGDQPLWVGRPVYDRPLGELRNTLVIRVLSIVFVLVVVIWIMARWFAARFEQLGNELFQGVRQMLEGGETVKFAWRGSPELRQLGESLSVLAETHACNTRNLQAHARELEASNRYKSEFLANVSHELRTPLNSILSLSKIMDKEALVAGDKQRERVRVIHEASRDLRDLIDNILDLSKIEAGRLTLQIETTDLPQLLQDLALLMQPQFDEKGLDLQLSIRSDALRSIRTDPDKLRQILKNFMSNAIKFTPGGSVILALEGAEAPFAVKLSVADSGIGIPEDKQAVIFEAFKQADGSTSRRYGGTGLGLSISRELAGILCGSIAVSSKQGDGATFSLLLPSDCAEFTGDRGDAGGARVEPEPEQTNIAPSPSADFSGYEVLLVEQDVSRLLILSQLLESWGMDVYAAGDEDEAVETLGEEPDMKLIIVASGVPGNDGYATIESMRERLSDKGRLFIALGEAEDGFAAGADKVLALPLDALELREVISRYLVSEAGPAWP